MWRTSEALERYGRLTGRTVLAIANLPDVLEYVLAVEPRETNAAISIVKMGFANNGIEITNQGERFALALPRNWRETPLAEQIKALRPPDERGGAPRTNMINFPSMDLNTFLSFYAEVCGRTLLRSISLPAATIHLQMTRPVTYEEMVYAMNTTLLLNGIVAVNDGDKFVQLVPLTDAAIIKTNAPKPNPGAPTIAVSDLPSSPGVSRTRHLPPPPVSPGLDGRPQTPPIPTPPADDLLVYYAKLSGRTAHPMNTWASLTIWFRTQTPLTKEEALYAIETVLRLNGLKIRTAEDNALEAVWMIPPPK
jgi:hypothetical protein